MKSWQIRNVFRGKRRAMKAAECASPTATNISGPCRLVAAVARSTCVSFRSGEVFPGATRTPKAVLSDIGRLSSLSLRPITPTRCLSSTRNSTSRRKAVCAPPNPEQLPKTTIFTSMTGRRKISPQKRQRGHADHDSKRGAISRSQAQDRPSLLRLPP